MEMKLPPDELFIKYAHGTLSPEEHTELMNWADQSPANHEFLDSIRNKEYLLEGATELRDAKELIWKKILQEHPELKIRQIPWRRLAAAAAIVAVLATGYFMFSKINKAENENIAIKSTDTTIIRTADGAAVLTLANGQKMVLDSAGSGVLASQGQTDIVKQQNGEIIYLETNRSSGTISLNSLENNGSTGTISLNTLETNKARQQQVILPDGSRVTLNALSRLEYPTTFATDNRNVSLKGEAFFEITKDSKRPFTVTVDDAQVRVLGTEFNLKSYKNEATVSTLFEGKIRMTSKSQTIMAIELAPGQEAIVDTATKRITLVNEANLAKAAAWRKGYFEFKDASIQDVMRELQRYYDFDVEYNAVVTKKFNGSLPHTLPLNTVFKVLEASRGVRLKINGKTVIVSQ